MEDSLTNLEHGIQQRTERLLGSDNLQRLSVAKVIIFGLGGVGSWCAEALVRTGIRHITLVDSDVVSLSNCNRQLLATTHTVGQPKVEVMRNRLLEINPDASILAMNCTYESSTADSFHLGDYDFIIDAIDSLKDKADLILRATSLPKSINFFSSMGAALRCDPFKVRKGEFWQIEGDALARALRKKFKHMEKYPARKFYCVYSDEVPMQNRGEAPSDDLPGHNKVQVNGSLCQLTATFGMALASMVINKITQP